MKKSGLILSAVLLLWYYLSGKDNEEFITKLPPEEDQNFDFNETPIPDGLEANVRFGITEVKKNKDDKNKVDLKVAMFIGLKRNAKSDPKYIYLRKIIIDGRLFDEAFGCKQIKRVDVQGSFGSYNYQATQYYVLFTDKNGYPLKSGKSLTYWFKGDMEVTLTQEQLKELSEAQQEGTKKQSFARADVEIIWMDGSKEHKGIIQNIEATLVGKE